jgi:rod shape-determining protein MreC
VYDKTVRRRRAVLGLLVASSLILLTAYFGESAGGGLHAVQRGVLEVVSPIQEGASRALKPFRDLAGWVDDTLSAKREVKDLRTERDTLRRSAVAGGAARREVAQLKELLRLNEVAGLAAAAPVGARVIGQDPSLWYGQVTINKGTADGVRVDHPVITGEGLIGRVSFASRSTAVVRLITDHTTNVSARVNASGVTGVVRVEAGRPNELVLDYTRRTDVVRPGQVVVTAGTQSKVDRLPSLYPPNVPIGAVTRVDDPATDDQQVHLRPFADLRRLEFVEVLTKAPNQNRPRS